MNNNKTKTAWLKVLLCLPAVLIVFFIFTLSGKGIDPAKVDSVEITVPGKEAVSYTDRADINFYVDMYMEADKISAPLRDISGVTPLTVAIKQKTEDTVLSVYPEVNSNGCFFADGSGTYYAVPSSTAKKLLQRGECAYVYRDAGYTLPTLTFVSDAGETVLLPGSYEWSYTDIAGNTAEDKDSPTATEEAQLSYSSNTVFQMKYSTAPATQTMSFSYMDKDGNLQTAHKPEELLFESDTMLSAEVVATWSESGKVKGGTATYKFKLLYDVKPEVTCSANTVAAGDVLVVKFKHLSESEELSLESDIYTGTLRPVFDGDNAWLLIPISRDIEGNGICSLNFKMGNYVHDPISIFVTGASGDFDTADMDTALYTEFITGDAAATYEALVKDLTANSATPSTPASDKYSKPVDGSVLHDFGAELIINGVAPAVRRAGIDYQLAPDSLIKATERGTVVYIAADKYFGNMMIIDHGNGVLSHYYNMGELSKQVGDTVTNGMLIGKAGVSGMTFMQGTEKVCMLHFAISVNGVFVDPEPFLKNGFPVR